MNEKRNIILPELKKRVFKRDGYKCRFCGRCDDFVCHEIEMQSLGGKPILNNCTTLCGECHHILHKYHTGNHSFSNATKAGLERAKANGKPVGKRGKDKYPREKAGYYNRWAKYDLEY